MSHADQNPDEIPDDHDRDRADDAHKAAPVFTTDTVKAITDAYYTQLVSKPGLARSRANAGYTIAAAVAAALAAAGGFGNIFHARWIVLVLGLSAFVGWLAAALLFMRAVATPVPTPKKFAKEVKGEELFVRGVVDRSDNESAAIDKRSKHARLMTAGAVFLTICTVILAAAVPKGTPWRHGFLTLSPRETQVLSSFCPADPPQPASVPPRTVSGSINVTSLEKSNNTPVEIRLDKGQCSQTETTAVTIPRDQVPTFIFGN